MGILSWIIFGLVAGVLAQLIMPGENKFGIVMTIVLGIIGAVVGGWVSTFLGIGGGRTVTGFNIYSFAIAVVGALIVLFIYGLLQKK